MTEDVSILDADFAQSVCYTYGTDERMDTITLTNAQGRSVSVGYGWYVSYERCQSPSEGAAELAFFWGPDLSGSLQGAGGVGGLVAVSVDGAWYFPGYDNNGNVIGYWDERGRLAAEFVYDAFGNPVGGHDAPYVHLPHRFSTKYHDAETDLYYYGYRYYSPSLGRWISRDPIEEHGGKNLNAFVANSPLHYLDRLGTSITGTISKYEDGGVKIAINIPIQIIDRCPNTPRLSEAEIQNAINNLWDLCFEEQRPVERQSENSPTLMVTDWVSVRKELSVQATVVTIHERAEFNSKNHYFLLSPEQSSNAPWRERTASHAKKGGKKAVIFCNDRSLGVVYSHEFGHWLNLEDVYNELDVEDLSAGTAYRSTPFVPGFSDNIMGANLGKAVTSEQFQTILEFLSKVPGVKTTEVKRK